MQLPTSPWLQPAPAGYNNMLYKEKEIVIPKWNGDSSGWHNMHTRLEVSLADLQKLYLLNETATNSTNAADSKLLARAFWSKFSDNALLPFSAQTEKYLNKGIEMYQGLKGIYAPVDEPTLLSLSKVITHINMQTKESIISFISRIRTINKDLTSNGQPWPETSLTLLAIQGLDSRRYGDLTTSFLSGVHSASTLTRLTQIVATYNKLNNIGAGSEYHTANATNSSLSKEPSENKQDTSTNKPNSLPLDKFSADGWKQEDAKTLMHKYKCFVCRTNAHLWSSKQCPLLRHWSIDKKKSHPSHPSLIKSPSKTGNKDTKGDSKVKDDDDKTKTKNVQKKNGSVSFVTTRSSPPQVPEYDMVNASDEKVEGTVNQVTSSTSKTEISEYNFQQEAKELATANPFAILSSPPSSPPPDS